MEIHPFDQAINLSEKNGSFIGSTSDKYANMIGPFGGIIAASMLHAVLKHSDKQGDPVSLTVNYVSPIKDGNFIIKPTIVKTNRSTQHWIVELFQDEGTAITATILLANRRETWSAREIDFPNVPEAKNLPRLKSEGMPKWIYNYDIRTVKGLPDLSEKAEVREGSTTIQWIQDHPKRPLDFLSLASICDAFFPRIYVRRNQIVPASTVSLTIYFHIDGKSLAEYGECEVLAEARALQFNQGFFDQTGEIWSHDGRLLATTSQIVYYKDGA